VFTITIAAIVMPRNTSTDTRRVDDGTAGGPVTKLGQYNRPIEVTMTAHELLGLVAASAFATATMAVTPQTQSATRPSGITDVPGIKVGHYTLSERPTGCTVVLADPPAVGAVDVRGGAPGTIETDLLRPDELVTQVNGIVLSGGSAFGLATQPGVMKFLEEQKLGFRFGGAYVPIVPGAIIFDLNVGGAPSIRPGPDCGYRAAAAAATGPVKEGSVGAGAGATVGKFGGGGRAMKGGVGTAAIASSGGLIVGALVVVNAAGSIIDPRTGKAIAGVRSADGKSLEDPFALIRRGAAPAGTGENTTIGVVATNARLTKAQANRVVAMAHDGLARAIVPAHTMSDGDTLFALATGTVDAEVNRVGVLAAEAVSDAILRAVRAATGLPGFPAAVDLK
jgi:L-aminopeptidase/D-esterase-like protein